MPPACHVRGRGAATRHKIKIIFRQVFSTYLSGQRENSFLRPQLAIKPNRPDRPSLRSRLYSGPPLQIRAHLTVDRTCASLRRKRNGPTGLRGHSETENKILEHRN
jgi:hypothetical protein